MTSKHGSTDQLARENQELRSRLATAEQALESLRRSQGDAPRAASAGGDPAGMAQGPLDARLKELTILHALSEIALRRQSLDAGLEEAAQLVSASTGFPIAAIERYDEGRGLMTFVASVGVPLQADHRALQIPADQTLSGLVARSGHPLVETQALDRSEYAAEALRGLGVQIFVCVPMVLGARVIGTLSVAHPSSIPLDPHLPTLLSSLANVIAAMVDRAQAEEDLRVALTKYRTLFDSFPLGITVSDQSGTIVEANPMAERLLGIARGDQTRRPIGGDELRLVRADGVPMPANLESIQDQAMASTVELGLIRASGATTWISVTAAPIPLAQGGIVVTYSDITERKRFEAALRESEWRMRNLLEHVPIGMFQSTIEGKYIYANPALAMIMGYTTPEELIASVNETSIGQVLYEDPARRLRLVDEVLRAQGRWRIYEHRYRRKGGEIFDAILTIAEREDLLTGQPALYGFVQDITARKYAEATIHGLAERLELATRAARMGVWDWDIQRNVLLWDDRMYELYGVRREDFAGAYEAWLQGLHPDDRVASDVVSAQARRGERPYDTEFRVVWPDGSLRVLKAYGDVIWDAEGRPQRMIGVNFDITELKHTEAALRQLNETLEQRVAERTTELARAARLKDEFLATMSHELRTPLNTVLGRTELLLEELDGPLTPRQAGSLRSIEASGRHLLALIDEILDLTRIGAGKLQLKIELVPVDIIGDLSLHMVAESASRKRITLTSSLDPRVAYISADEHRLTQILVNLLTNAVKFTPEGGAVGLEVRGDPEQQSALFTVWDTGIGIAEADIPHLFQPFVQLDGGLNRQYEGTGLGLALVRRLAEAHHGRVEVTSAPGQGSRFCVSLPWSTGDATTPGPGAPQPSRPGPPAAATGAQARSGRPRILLADDDAEHCQLVSAYLEAHGYAVDVAHDGGEALARVQEDPPAVVLMDLQMPGLDGLEAIRQMRSDARLGAVPIVALTALTMPGDRERCLAAGASDYLSKPVRLKDLAALIGSLR